MLYNDKDVKVREGCVTIKTYYFPFGTSRRIPIDSIRDVCLIKEASSRVWGTGSFDYWFALDKNRMEYECFIAIDTGESMKPAFTCTNNEQVYVLIKELVARKQAGLM